MTGTSTNKRLPIYELEPQLLSQLPLHNRLIIQAPTGSGKSTQIPQILHNAGISTRGQTVILQPRRLATRMLAKRVAEEMNTPLGKLVGYQIRLDSVVSEHTKILFVTEGVLLRKMSFDPSLAGISTLIFDEFHERHLYGDISLARALQIQKTTRPDLNIIVMSATLDTATLANYLAPCPVLTSQGRTFPVEIHYLPKTPNFDITPVWDIAAEQAAAIATTTPGDILIFMPGAYEISRTIQALREQRQLHQAIILPLHGELPADQQDLAVSRTTQKKIIVSTNVAETSLTIDGITAVIDSGQARIARFDPHRGINTLLIEKISIASADQRAGRAGRTAPGTCHRLWTKTEHSQRQLQELPEVRRLDLAEVVLTLKAAHIEDISTFPWLEAPDPRALSRAHQLLQDLGALTQQSTTGTFTRITETGQKMLRFPVHPRYARMFLEAHERQCVRPIALIAAITQNRNFLLRSPNRDTDDRRSDLFGDETQSDFFFLIRIWNYVTKTNPNFETLRSLSIHAQAVRQVAPLFQQFLNIAEQEHLDLSEHRPNPDQIRKCILAGFSDHLAKRVDTGTLRCDIIHNRRGLLSRDSALQTIPLLVAAEITEIQNRDGDVNTLLNLCTAIEEPWLSELFPNDFSETITTLYDLEARRVITRRQRTFRDLVLTSKSTADSPNLDTAAQLLAQQILAGNITLAEWNESVDQWILRVNTLAKHFPEYEVAPITPADRLTLLEQICYGSLGARELKDKPVMPILRDWLTAEQLSALETTLPDRLTMPNNRRAHLTYQADGNPTLSARIQELFDIPGTFTLGNRLPVTIEILAPNHRPIQVTNDLATFWRDTYPTIKPALSRRYPRHEWR